MKKIKSPNVGISANTHGLDFVQKHTVSIFPRALPPWAEHLVPRALPPWAEHLVPRAKKKNYVNKLTLLLTFFGLFIVIVGVWRSFDYFFVLILLVFFPVHFTFVLLVHAEEFSSG